MDCFLCNSLATFLHSHDLVLLDLPPEEELNKNNHLIDLAALQDLIIHATVQMPSKMSTLGRNLELQL